MQVYGREYYGDFLALLLPLGADVLTDSGCEIEAKVFIALNTALMLSKVDQFQLM